MRETKDVERKALLKKAAATFVEQLVTRIRADAEADPETREVFEKMGEDNVRRFFEVAATPVILIVEDVSGAVQKSVVDLFGHLAKAHGDPKLVQFVEIVRAALDEMDQECGFVRTLAEGLPPDAFAMPSPVSQTVPT